MSRRDVAAEHGRTSLAALAAAFMLGFAVPGLCLAQDPGLSPRQPLLDALAREEVEGYARLDGIMQQSAALPDVFDPGIYATDAQTADLRGRVLGYLLWLRGAEARDLERIESLPTRLESIDTHEPYRADLIALYRDSTPERYRMIHDFYEGEVAAAEQRVAMLDFLDQHGIRARDDGFLFSNQAEVDEYHDLVARMNDIAALQDRRIGDYYAWELGQKAALRQFRDQL